MQSVESFDSIRKLPKSLEQQQPITSPLSLLFSTQNTKNPENPSYEELKGKYEGLLIYIRQMEQAYRETPGKNQNEGLEMTLLETKNFKLREEVQYLEETMTNERKEINEKLKAKEKSIEELKGEVGRLREEIRVLNEGNRKLEESARISNANFTTFARKNAALTRENEELNKKLALCERERMKYSVKWQQASNQARSEMERQQKVKEMESELLRKQKECEEMKKKYVAVMVELRLAKETEAAYRKRMEQKLQLVQKSTDETKKEKEKSPQSDKEKKGEDAVITSEALMKENGELYRSLNEYSGALERCRMQCSELEQKNKQLMLEVDIAKQRSEGLNLANEKLHISYSQLLNETRTEEKEVEGHQEPEKDLDFIRNSHEYRDLSSSIKDNHGLRAKVDGLILFIQENDPQRKELGKMKKLYERLVRKYNQLEKQLQGTKSVLENSKSTTTNLFNSMVSACSKESGGKKTNLGTGDESFLQPKRLFEAKKDKRMNRSFELDKQSCKRHGCGEKEPKKEVRKVNLTSFLRENKSNSYLLNYITNKKN